MSQESANWCRFAKLMINKGAEVLRTFIQLEIFTWIFRDYSTSWGRRMDALKVNYTEKLQVKLQIKLNMSDEKTLKKLIQTRDPALYETATINEQIDQIKEWKKDIEKAQKNHYSEDVKKILDECLKNIEKKIEKLNKRNTFISKWNDTFFLHLHNAQRALVLQVEETDQFLNDSVSKLISNYKLSNVTLRKWDNDLYVWKNKCCSVIREFKTECDNLILSGCQEAQNDEVMVDCLNKFKNDIKKINLNFQIDSWFDNWYTDLKNVFDTCFKGDYEQAMSMLPNISSFRDMKITMFFRQVVSSAKGKKRERMDKLITKLGGISRAKDLEKLDLTFLVDVLKVSKVVNSQTPYADEELPDWDTSTGADILRLKSHRNDIVAHIGEAKLSSRDFEMLWRKVKTLLCTIASRCGDKFKTKISEEIDTMKTIPLEICIVQQFRKEITEWCQKDIENEFPSHLQQGLKNIDIAKQNMMKARTCSQCKMTLPTESELAEHMKIHEVYHCDVCNMQCSTEWALQQHKMTHQGPNAAGVAAAAGTGAAVGGVLGPPGAVLGAAIGGLIGFLSSRK